MREIADGTPRPISAWWRHGTLLVMAFGFSVLALVTVLTYTNAPPIPRRVVDPAGHLLFTGDEVESGQEVFFQHALMEHGTLWGHGAYLGPDYTAEHLHREVAIARNVRAQSRFGKPFTALAGDVTFLALGALPIAVAAVLSILRREGEPRHARA